MVRSLIVCLGAALMLSACSSDTTNTAGGPGGGPGAGGPGTAGQGSGRRGVPGSQDDLTQYAGDRIFFETDQSVVTDQARRTLDLQVEWLRQNPSLRIWVAGNCDERGTEEYNLALGARRAGADRDYMVSRGVAANRIETISYGKSRPVDPASTDEAWARNRNAITSVR